MLLGDSESPICNDDRKHSANPWIHCLRARDGTVWLRSMYGCPVEELDLVKEHHFNVAARISVLPICATSM